MSLGAVPDADEMIIFGGLGLPGRQLRTRSGVPVAWVTDKAFPAAGPMWADLSEKSAGRGLDGFRRAEGEFRRWPGLQPFLLSGLGVESMDPKDRAGVRPDGLRPWDTGEQVGDPEDTAAIDRMDAARLLEGWWGAPGEDELAEDPVVEDLRAMFAPFGTRFPAVSRDISLLATHPAA